VVQSVELLLDPTSGGRVRYQWQALHSAGLPSEYRAGDGSHRPHLTLLAADALPAEAEAALPALVTGLDLTLQVGALMIFGPRRGRVVLVRQVTPSIGLLRLQDQVGEVCGAAADGHFGPGRWSPHVTLARRLPIDQVGRALEVLGSSADQPLQARVTQCRRWDGSRKVAWLL
jgi:2'-5' RNA ligase